MADVTKITLPDGTTKDIKDATARSQIQTVYDANGAKNLFNFDAWKDVTINRGTKEIIGKSIKLTATAADCSTSYDAGIYPIGAEIPVTPGETITFTWSYTAHSGQAAGDDKVFMFWNGVSSTNVQAAATAGIISQVVPSGKTFVTFRVGVATSGNSATYSNIMFCHANEYAISNTYKDYALPNTKITPELIELVDNGAKNELKLITPYGSGITNNPNLTVTLNPDQTITVNGSATTSGSIVISNIISGKLGKYLSGRPAGVTADIRLTAYAQPSWSAVGNDYNGKGATITDNGNIRIAIYVIAGQSYSNVTFKPMICSKAAWDVSQKFMPYYPTYKETVEQTVLLEQYGGGINLLNNKREVGTVTEANITIVTNSDKTITLTRTQTASSNAFITITDSQYLEAGTYVLMGCPAGGSGSSYELRFLTPDGQAYIEDKGDGAEFTLATDGTITSCVMRIDKTYNPNGIIFKPMILRKSDYDRGYRDYQPYALPNVKLTPALIECVDSGKKNLLNEFSLTTGTAGEISVVVDSDRMATLNTNGATTGDSGVRIGYFTGEAGKTYVVSNASTSVGLRVRYGGTTIVLDTFTNASFVAPDSSKAELIWFVPRGTTLTNYLLKPMVCRKELWDVSQKYVPYAMNNAELTPTVYVTGNVSSITVTGIMENTNPSCLFMCADRRTTGGEDIVFMVIRYGTTARLTQLAGAYTPTISISGDIITVSGLKNYQQITALSANKVTITS